MQRAPIGPAVLLGRNLTQLFIKTQWSRLGTVLGYQTNSSSSLSGNSASCWGYLSSIKHVVKSVYPPNTVQCRAAFVEVCADVLLEYHADVWLLGAQGSQRDILGAIHR